ncbi:MAG: integration host factor subunit beta [Anaerolineaceae bacterium]|nr:integration host factor subunit beta [Anaerolineaceae bacterium]
MATITKKDLVGRITETTQAKQSSVKTIVQCILDEIIAELAKNNRLEFRDFGVFEVRERAARTAQNPKTMEKVQVPAKKKVRFKMGRIMREKLSNNTME